MFVASRLLYNLLYSYSWAPNLCSVLISKVNKRDDWSNQNKYSAEISLPRVRVSASSSLSHDSSSCTQRRDWSILMLSNLFNYYRNISISQVISLALRTFNCNNGLVIITPYPVKALQPVLNQADGCRFISGIHLLLFYLCLRFSVWQYLYVRYKLQNYWIKHSGCLYENIHSNPWKVLGRSDCYEITVIIPYQPNFVLNQVLTKHALF